MFLWLGVQDTCNYYDMVNEDIFKSRFVFFITSPILLGLYPQNTCNYCPWLMRLFNCRFVVFFITH